MKKHWLTTLFGFLLAVSSWVAHDPSLAANKAMNETAAIIQGAAALALGAAAADARNDQSKK